MGGNPSHTYIVGVIVVIAVATLAAFFKIYRAKRNRARISSVTFTPHAAPYAAPRQSTYRPPYPNAPFHDNPRPQSYGLAQYTPPPPPQLPPGNAYTNYGRNASYNATPVPIAAWQPQGVTPPYLGAGTTSSWTDTPSSIRTPASPYAPSFPTPSIINPLPAHVPTHTAPSVTPHVPSPGLTSPPPVHPSSPGTSSFSSPSSPTTPTSNAKLRKPAPTMLQGDGRSVTPTAVNPGDGHSATASGTAADGRSVSSPSGVAGAGATHDRPGPGDAERRAEGGSKFKAKLRKASSGPVLSVMNDSADHGPGADASASVNARSTVDANHVAACGSGINDGAAYEGSGIGEHVRRPETQPEGGTPAHTPSFEPPRPPASPPPAYTDIREAY